jgi:hypothetical protein
MKILAITDPSFIVPYTIVGVTFGTLFFYFFWCAVARQWIKVDFYELAIYMSAGFLVAILTEPFHDYVFRYLTGEFLWIYQVWPLFGGPSSGLAFITWPFYGYHAYFMIKTFKRYGVTLPVWLRGTLPAIDGVPFDMITNGASLFFYNIIFFYYPREELWHLSSWWVIPMYLVSGMMMAYLIDFLLKKERDWKLPITCYFSACVCMIVGEIFTQFMI